MKSDSIVFISDYYRGIFALRFCFNAAACNQSGIAEDSSGQVCWHTRIMGNLRQADI